MSPATAEFLIISFSTDWRFSPARSKEIMAALLENNKRVSYIEIQSKEGHDSFLKTIPRYHEVMGSSLNRIALEIGI